LTKHRDGLKKLLPFNKKRALQTVRQVEHYGEKCKKQRGTRVFYCADELYMMAGLELPENDFYEDYPQLENGVGMMRLFITEFEEALMKEKPPKHCPSQQSTHQPTPRPSQPAETEIIVQRCPTCGSLHKRKSSSGSSTNPLTHQAKKNEITIVTGVLAYPFLSNLLIAAAEKYGTINGEVYAIRNDIFGESVTVSGLITGSDIITQLQGKKLGTKLLIPKNMLKHGEEVFLDDVTVSELSKELGVSVRIVEQDGADLLRALLEHQGENNAQKLSSNSRKTKCR